MTLIQRIHQKNITPGVIGLGDIGLPLAVAFAKVGFRGPYAPMYLCTYVPYVPVEAAAAGPHSTLNSSRHIFL